VGPDNELYNGHQRLAYLLEKHGPDYEVDVRRADRSLTEEERHQLTIFLHAGAVGSWDWDVIVGWSDADRVLEYGMDESLLDEWNSDAANLALMLETAEQQEKDLADDSTYSRKVEAPIYEPRGEKPAVADLYDNSRTRALIEEIDASDLPEEEKAFLRIAAQRHTVLRFDRIADYYAHSPAATQELMENNALVIIDFDRAVELGFVRLTERIARLVEEEHGDGY
jgi:hypothetical protein